MLCACEFSGRVRDAFLARGHDAWSCDLRPTDSPGPHHQCDVRDILGDSWDMMIGHPTCTYLTNSSVGWLTHTPKNPTPGRLYGKARWAALDEAAEFFRLLLTADIDRICLENPIPHCHAMQRIGRPYSQVIQPWQFGHGETKATCLWLKNLPLLYPTHVNDSLFDPPQPREREQRLHRLGPSQDREKIRSTTYAGIATAMAEQWTDI